MAPITALWFRPRSSAQGNVSEMTSLHDGYYSMVDSSLMSGDGVVLQSTVEFSCDCVLLGKSQHLEALRSDNGKMLRGRHRFGHGRSEVASIGSVLLLLVATVCWTHFGWIPLSIFHVDCNRSDVK